MGGSEILKANLTDIHTIDQLMRSLALISEKFTYEITTDNVIIKPINK